MITIHAKGSFDNTDKYLQKALHVFHQSKWDHYGQMGVEALAANTPKRTGKTANSWTYEVDIAGQGVTITWLNTNENKGVNIAIILQYGHGTGTGGYVQGQDYINPAMKPVFDEIAEAVSMEVKRL